MDKTYIHKLMSNFINAHNEFTFDDIINNLGEHIICSNNVITLVKENLDILIKNNIIVEKDGKYIRQDKFNNVNITLHTSCEIDLITPFNKKVRVILLDKSEDNVSINVQFDMQETDIVTTKEDIKQLIEFLKECL